MYQIFFQPFEATEVMKKGSNKAFTLMLVIGCALMALAGLLFMQTPPMAWAREITKDIPWNALSYVQYFLMFFVGIFLMNLVRAFFVHLVMHMFTDKGGYMDSLKVMAVNSFLTGVYILIAIIVGAIPYVGPGLVVLVAAVGMLIVISVTIRGLTVLYKTEIITTWIALSVLILTVIAACHIGFAIVGGGNYMHGRIKTIQQ